MKASRKGFLGLLLMIVLIVILSALTSKENSSKPAVYNSAWDNSVWQAEKYLKHNLKDPDSYQSIEWSKVSESNGVRGSKYIVRNKYRAKNSLGGYVIENKIFFLSEKGDVLGATDFNPN